ncbi:MAG: DUF559 domain-containing protein [Myxococcota bacterium]
MGRGLIRHQPVSRQKLAFAKAMRREPTPAEEKLWNALRNNKLQRLHFRRQQVLAGFIVDNYCDRAGISVEIDGDIHDLQPAEDAARTKALNELGLRVLRVRNEAVLHNLETVLDEIAAACGRPRDRK